MTDYNVNFTDVNKTPLTVTAENKRVSGIDIEMFGRAFLEYGEQLNENLLHILENFACPENPLLPGNPDVTETVNEALTEPIEGQWWYNTSSETMYFWSGSSWIPLGNRTDYAANWGQIADGGQLPKPVSSITGYVFPYEECIWSVAPALFDAYFDWMACVTDSEANVTMKYRYAGEETPISGNVNYLIIGIKGNNNNGVTPIPVPSPTPSEGAPPTPTPTPTTTVTPTITITPTISLTPSVTPSVGSSPTPTPTKTATLTPTPTRSATPTPSEDVTPSPTPSNTPSPTPSVTPTSSPIPPTPTPTSSPEYDPLSASWAGGNSNAYAAHLVGVPNCLNPVGPGSDSESVTMNVTGGSGDYTIVVDEGSGAEQCNGSGSGNSTTTTTYSIGSNSLVLTAGITWNGHCTDKSRILVIDITITDNVTLEEVLLSGTAFAQVYIGLSGGNNCP